MLHWVVYALASATDPGFIWTDVRPAGETADPSDPIGRGLIPPGRLNVVLPAELAVPRAPAAAGAPAPNGPTTVQRLADFVRLPLHTQRLLTGEPRGAHPMVVVLSNAQRLEDLYANEDVGGTLKRVVEAGTTMLVSFSGPAPQRRSIFPTVLRVEGSDLSRWREAAVAVEAASPEGGLTVGSSSTLGTFAPVAAGLRAIGP